MIYLRIFGAVCALVGTFLFGMWLAWPDFLYNPSGFPIDRKFVAISLNSEPLILREAPKLATLEVRGRTTFRHRVGGHALCGDFGGHLTFLPGRRIRWGTILRTAAQCRAGVEQENRYLAALLTSTRWRTEKDTLILENGTDILRFGLATY
jgi:heat shock protein HslJ